MDQHALASWVATHILPWEAAVRGWLRQVHISGDDADDLIQEAYCKLAQLDSVAHITQPRAYFFRIVRNLHLEQIRRAKIVRFESITENDCSSILSDEPSPDIAVAAKQKLDRVRRLIEELPHRCRRIFELRKIHDVPQREIAQLLGVSETIVENDVVKGMRLIMQRIRADEGTVEIEKKHERPAKRRRD